jgi:protease IV
MLDHSNEPSLHINEPPVHNPTTPSAQACCAKPESKTFETMTLALIAEHRAMRRWKMFWRFFWVLLLGGSFFATSMRSNNNAPTKTHTAVIEIRGEIAAESDANAHQIMSSLKAAFEEKTAQAIILVINSPGGSPVQAGMINDEINRLKALHKKPVYVVVGDVCASAAYYIASAADAIYVDKASIVGSIGVLMDGFGFTGLMEKLGIERRLLTAGENKGFLDPFSPQTEEHKQYAKNMLHEIHEQFIGVVRKGRGDRLKQTPDMFSGLFWSGQQAIEMGLARSIRWHAMSSRLKSWWTTPTAKTWPSVWPNGLVRLWVMPRFAL